MNQVTVLNDESRVVAVVNEEARLVMLLPSRVDTEYSFVSPTQVYENNKDVSP